MPEPLDQTAFRQGFKRGLSQLMVKRALNPRMAGAASAPFIDAELRALGERLFHESHRSPGVLKGLKATALSGYGQLRNIHNLQAGAHTPDQLSQAFTALGATAKPRINFINRAVPAAAGLGIGGAAAAGINRVRGRQEGQAQTAQALEQMPLMARLKYLMSPRAFGSPQPAAEDSY